MSKLLEEITLEKSAPTDSLGNSSLDEIRGELLDGAGGLAAAARRVMRWQALLSCLAIGLAALLLLMLGDMLLRREEFGLRVLALLAWLLVLIWSAKTWLRPAWRFSLTPVQVAQWIEGERPELGQQLSTAVELAQLPVADTRFGSSHFREVALRGWSTSGQSINWSRHLQRRGLRRAGVLLLAIGGLIVALSSLWPTEMRVAFARLAVPWSANAWPHRDQLRILQLPTVVAAGSELQLEVIDERPPLPDRVELQVREVDSAQNTRIRTLETTVIGDLAVGNLPSINSSFEVRAVGGDDQRSIWHRVDVVQPPELTEFQFTVETPKYAGLDRHEVVGRRISVLAGSQVEFSGRFDRPVSQVVVDQSQQAVAKTKTDTQSKIESNTDDNTPTQQPWTVGLDNDGRGLHLGGQTDAMLAVQHSLVWQLSIATADGLETLLPERWSIEVTEDSPPRVIFQTADLAELASNAQLNLRGSAADDLGLVEVRARLQLAGDEATPAASLSIWKAALNEGDMTSATEQPREFNIDARWSIAQAGAFVAGQTVAVWLEASDNAGQWSQSQVQEYAIRDQRELIESIQEKQNQLLTQVRELVDTQRRNTQLFSRTWELAHRADKLGRDQIDSFLNAAQVQRAVAERLGVGIVPQGLTQEIAKLSELLTRNRLDGTELALELKSLAADLHELSQGAMAKATTTTAQTAALAEASKAAEAIAPNLTDSAAQTQLAQSEALRGLERLLDRLARNESIQQIERELSQILNQQNAIRGETDRLHMEGLANSSEESRAQRQTRQTALSADQQGLARRLDDWLARAADLQASGTADQQAAKTELARATESLSSAQASALMRRSTEEIRDTQLARAATTQQQVSELLSDTLRRLGAGNQSQLGGLRNRAEGLRQLSSELSDLASVQSALSERWQAPNAASTRERLLADQAAAEQRTRAAASQAEQAGDGSLATEIERASTAQEQAQSAGKRSDFHQATRASQQAAQQLEQSSQQLEQRAADLEQQVAEQQMFQLAVAIEQLSTRQKPIAEQFNQWADIATDELPEETRESHQGEMRQAASRQEEVRQMLREVRAETTALPTFDWTLEQAELSMGRAVAAAKRYRIAPDAKQAAGGALRLLQMASDAMREQRPNETSDGLQPTTDEENTADEAPQEDVPQRPAPFVASLKLLRSLQQELNEQTLNAESIDDAARRTGQLSEIANMQQLLAAQIEQLLREASPSGGN